MKVIKGILIALAVILVVVSLFSLTVLIYGGITGETFIEVLRNWFSFLIPATPVTPTV